MKKRSFLQSAALLAAVSTFSLAQAQTPTPIKFQLDWRFEGPAALFLQPVAKGHFKAAGLDVTVDAGNGSGGAVQRVASGSYDMGFADLAAVMEFHANNPDAQNKPVALADALVGVLTDALGSCPYLGRAAALATASAVILSTRRTVAAGVRM